MNWQDVDISDQGLRSMMEGKRIISVEPMIFESTGLFQIVLHLDDGTDVRFDAIAMHGMEAAIGVSVPDYCA